MSVWYEWFPTDLIVTLRDSSEIGDMSDKTAFLDSISTLDLSGLRLSTVPDFIKEMKNLKTLSLANNRIKGSLDGSKFPDNLEFLSLANNGIDSFSFEGFNPSCLKSLSGLDLSGNKLKTLPDKVYLSVSLHSLNLSNNMISEIDKDIKLPSNIYAMNLEGNLLESVRAGRYGITKCSEINLSNNKLSTLDTTLLKGKVSIIDVSGNDIKDWDFIGVAKKKGIAVFS